MSILEELVFSKKVQIWFFLQKPLDTKFYLENFSCRFISNWIWATKCQYSESTSWWSIQKCNDHNFYTTPQQTKNQIQPTILKELFVFSLLHFLQPFVEAEHFLHQFFLPKIFAVLIPLIGGIAVLLCLGKNNCPKSSLLLQTSEQVPSTHVLFYCRVTRISIMTNKKIYIMNLSGSVGYHFLHIKESIVKGDDLFPILLEQILWAIKNHSNIVNIIPTYIRRPFTWQNSAGSWKLICLAGH